jgi:flagellar hook-associated protein 2
MGAVGLNFGNPSSGDGFNVTQTVSEIMANYQMVEAPWEQQLSTLSAEDAAYSTIGTDLQNLSTAYSTLSNFQGVLEGKQGSSSDPNVVELTAASTTAMTGSHTIVVNSLATNDSWSSSSISSGTTLGTGDLTIQVGTGGATSTVNIANGESLSTLASSINNAGIGVEASVLTNSTGSYLSLVSSTSGSAADLTIGGSVTTSGTTPTSLSFTNVSQGMDASLTVDGNAVTSSSNTVTDAIPGVTFEILSTSPTTTSGGSTTATPTQVLITNDTADVTSALDLFVSAYNTVMTAVATQEGDSPSGTPEPLYGNTNLASLQEQLGQMTNITQTSSWDSSLTPVSLTDTLTGTLNVSIGTGTELTYQLGAGETLSQLASSINTPNSPVTASVLTEAGGSYLQLVSNTGGTAGNLQVTSSVTDSTTNSGLAFVQTAEGSSINSFGALGISSLTYGGTGSVPTANPYGTLSIDSDTLSSALNTDYQAVVNFFQEASAVGMKFFDSIPGLGTPTAAESGGIVSAALYSDQQQESTLSANISNENMVMSSEQASLTAELELANQTLQAIPSQVNEVNELYAAITGYSSTGSSS